jgi:outer membrane protein assembly factor BamD (BamD/ComL family)
VIRRLAGVLGLVLVIAAAARAADVSALEQRARAFYALLEKGQRDRAAAKWPQLERDLMAADDQIRADKDRIRKDLDADADEPTQAVQDPRLRQLEIESLIVSYHLAWVRYQGAQLVDDAGRKRTLLENAVDGFSKFTDMKEVPEVYAESLYGRGLAAMDLGDWANARQDLRAAAGLSRTAAKAKAALAEVDRKESGKPAEPEAPAEYPDQALLDKLAAGLPKASTDPAAEKDVTTLARGLAARGGEWPAKVQTLVTEKLGDGTNAGVRSSYGLFLLGQLAIDRNRCAELPPLAAAGAGVKDAGRARWRPELLFLDGGCLLNAGKAADAAPVLEELVREFPDAPRAPEAAYLRFRALDVARGTDPARGAAFEDALVTYIQRYPKADNVAEARWLLGDLYRSRGDCAKAAAELGKVMAGAYATRARFAALECRATMLGPKTTPEERAALVRDLRAFVEATPPKGEDGARAARAALMGALVAVGTTPPDHATIVALLSGFEQRYPGSKELVPRVVETRLTSRVALGQLAEADSDLDAYLALEAEADRPKLLSKLGREMATRAARADDPERNRAQAMARKIYAALIREGGDDRDRVQLADLELAAGDAAAARKIYDEVLAKDATSAEALRGAARAAAAGGDSAGALGYWRQVIESSEPGGTSWYEARIAQVMLLSGDGRQTDACNLLHSSRGRSKTAGGDALAKRLVAMEPQICK